MSGHSIGDATRIVYPWLVVVTDRGKYSHPVRKEHYVGTICRVVLCISNTRNADREKKVKTTM